MPRLTGADAKKYYIDYLSDEFDGVGNPLQYRLLVSLRHIHWLQAIDPTLVTTTYTSAPVLKASHRKARKVRMAHTGTKKSHYLVWPFVGHPIWNRRLEDQLPTTYTLSGEGAGWRISGKVGEKDSSGFTEYDGVS